MGLRHAVFEHGAALNLRAKTFAGKQDIQTVWYAGARFEYAP